MFVVVVLESVIGLLGFVIVRNKMGGVVNWGFIVVSLGVGMLVGGLFVMKINVKYFMWFGIYCVFLLSGILFVFVVLFFVIVIVCIVFFVGVGI